MAECKVIPASTPLSFNLSASFNNFPLNIILNCSAGIPSFSCNINLTCFTVASSSTFIWFLLPFNDFTWINILSIDGVVCYVAKTGEEWSDSLTEQMRKR
eukprot:238446_1